MKNSFFFLLLFSGLSAPETSAQCTDPKALIDLNGNNIRARLTTGGDLFCTPGSDGVFVQDSHLLAGTFPATTIFAAGLWLGGIDPAGNFKTAIGEYRGNGEHDFSAGPLSFDGQTAEVVCQKWDRFFSVKRADVDSLLANLPTLQANPAAFVGSKYARVKGWPGRGNPYFQEVQGFDLPFTSQQLAPFFDADDDGNYDPLKGDYPAVSVSGTPPFVPDELVWCVFNDGGDGAIHSTSGGRAFPVEVQLTAWAFDCAAFPVVSNTVFTAHKVIYRGSENVDSCFIGLWADFDIGCHLDDFVGCNPYYDSFFAFNKDTIDGVSGTACPILHTFGNRPPAQSATFLSHSLDKFMAFNSSATAQGSPINGAANEYFNLLNGHWRDGKPLTFGNSGYSTAGTPTDLAFPADPTDPGGWSMCRVPSFGQINQDRRTLGSHKIGTLSPGQVEELVAAWTWHPDPLLPCNLGSTFDDIAIVRQLYANDFQNVCSPFVSAGDLKMPDPLVFPNPFDAELRVSSDGPPLLGLRLFDFTGRLCAEIDRPGKYPETSLPTIGLPSGIYFLEIRTSAGITRKSAIKMGLH